MIFGGTVHRSGLAPVDSIRRDKGRWAILGLDENGRAQRCNAPEFYSGDTYHISRTDGQDPQPFAFESAREWHESTRIQSQYNRPVCYLSLII